MDDDDKNEFAGFSFPPGIPDEEKRKYVDAYHKRQLEATASQHELFSFLGDLNNDQLRILDRFLTAIFASESRRATIVYYQGVIQSMRHEKFNICVACDVDHDKELLPEGNTES